MKSYEKLELAMLNAAEASERAAIDRVLDAMRQSQREFVDKIHAAYERLKVKAA